MQRRYFPAAPPAAAARSISVVNQTTKSVRGYPGKRLLDVTLVTLAAPVWLVVLGVLGALVRIKLGTPVIFRQTRPGLDGQPFQLLKLRTMTNQRGPDGGLLSDAERLTPFGRFLRSTSLDELPELWNVWRGEMSLVGPRPLLMQYLERYSEKHRRRHEVRPGITGLAQVSGRNALSWPEKFDLDIYYVEHCSLHLDLAVLWRTAKSVLRREGISAHGDVTMPEFRGYEESASR
jgi:lipopolysaccharide/colanic/teichoic acid biosynthesis glycosyltransferase